MRAHGPLSMTSSEDSEKRVRWDSRIPQGQIIHLAHGRRCLAMLVPHGATQPFLDVILLPYGPERSFPLPCGIPILEPHHQPAPAKSRRAKGMAASYRLRSLLVARVLSKPLSMCVLLRVLLMDTSV